MILLKEPSGVCFLTLRYVRLCYWIAPQGSYVIKNNGQDPIKTKALLTFVYDLNHIGTKSNILSYWMVLMCASSMI